MPVSNYLNILAWNYKFQSQNLYLSRSELLFKIKSRRLHVPYQKVFNFSNIFLRFRNSSDIFIYVNLKRSFLSTGAAAGNLVPQLVSARFLQKFFFARNALPLLAEDIYLTSDFFDRHKDYVLYGVYNCRMNAFFDPLFYEVCTQFYSKIEFSNANFFFFYLFKYIYRPFDIFLPVLFNIFGITSNKK